MAAKIEQVVFVANWDHTWGEFRGCLGVFSTRALAEQALTTHAPKANHHVDEFIVDEVDLDGADTA